MLTAPWVDPRSIDFTDSFNPLARPRWYKDRNPFMYNLLMNPMWQALRMAKNLEAQIYIAPDPINQTIQPGTSYDQSVNIEPQTWLYGINSRGSINSNFLVQITDAVTGATVWSQPPNATVLGPGNSNGLIVFLEEPRYFNPPAFPILRIVNQHSAAQVITVNLFCVVERIIDGQ